jgi:two-component system sensor histidine kinase BaeS
MKMSIKHRLYLAFLAATGLVVVSMFLITKFSFERSLLRYVNTMEQERLVRLETLLKEAYLQHRSWDFLHGNRRLWKHLLMISRHENIPFATRHEFPKRGPEPAPPGFRPRKRAAPPMHQTFDWRVSLLDGEKRPIHASPTPVDKILFRPISVENRIIGYLGLTPPVFIIDDHQRRFAQEQRRSMIFLSLFVAAAVALLSLPLSRRMVKRLTNLAEATHGLTAGRYDIRVDEAGGDELGQLARDFNSLARALENNEASRRRWVADISHELRTPLAILRGEIEAVQDGVRPLSEQTLETLHGEVMRLERLVGDLYELSLSDIGALQYRKSAMDLAEVLRHTTEAHRAEFDDKGIGLHTRGIATSLPFQGDAERMSQLFSNLLKNTLRYTDPGGKLEISAEMTKTTIQLNFMDSAPGVPEASLPRLFDRLYRVENSRSREHGGAGLGLALCRNIVEAHNGTIEARPSPLGGLWIAIILPLNG